MSPVQKFVGSLKSMKSVFNRDENDESFQLRYLYNSNLRADRCIHLPGHNHISLRSFEECLRMTLHGCAESKCMIVGASTTTKNFRCSSYLRGDAPYQMSMLTSSGNEFLLGKARKPLT